MAVLALCQTGVVSVVVSTNPYPRWSIRKRIKQTRRSHRTLSCCMPVVFHLFSFPSKLILFDQLSFETFFSEVNTLQHDLVCWQPLLSCFQHQHGCAKSAGFGLCSNINLGQCSYHFFFLFVFLLSAHFYNAG